MSSSTPPIKPAQFKGSYHEYGLYLHNWYRKRHGAPPLTLATWMNESGDNYCYKLARNGGMLIHSTGLGYGENLWGGPQAEAWLRHEWPQSSENYMHKCAVREAIEAWYNEVKYYSFGSGGFSMQTGHFTAMVWKGSTELGIGVSWVGGTIIVAGCYKVFPNMQGHFRDNVLQYRSVVDTDDEEEQDAEPDVEVEDGDKVKDGDDAQGDGDPDENAPIEGEVSLEIGAAFEEVADADGTVGWYELKDLLAKVEGGDKVKFDKSLCRMMIKTATERDKISERITLLAYENLVNCLKQSMESFVKVDKDESGYLDPFEVRDAFSGGHDISYAEVEGLLKAVGEENGKMSLYGFILAELLLCSLSSSDLGIPEDDHQAIVEWMEKQIEFVKGNKPLSELK